MVARRGSSRAKPKPKDTYQYDPAVTGKIKPGQTRATVHYTAPGGGERKVTKNMGVNSNKVNDARVSRSILQQGGHGKGPVEAFNPKDAGKSRAAKAIKGGGSRTSKAK